MAELDWAMAEDDEVWADVFEHLAHTDTLILGRGMYPDYERYWLAGRPIRGRILAEFYVKHSEAALDGMVTAPN
jgi:hypothetical protein